MGAHLFSLSDVTPLMSVKLMVILARGSKQTVKVTSHHVLLAEKNMVFKWAILCAMSVWLLSKSRNLS